MAAAKSCIVDLAVGTDLTNGNGAMTGEGHNAPPGGERNVDEAIRDYRLLVQNAGDGIAKLDENGRFLFANQRFLEIVARDLVSLARCRVADLVHFEDRAQDGPKFLQPGRFETRFANATGKTVAVDVVVTMIAGAIGGPASGGDPPREIMALVRDVTEQRRIERELLQREKLQSLGLLAGGVAHDLNNFLAVVQTSRSMAERAAKNGEQVLTYLQEIQQACAQAASLCTRLLSAAGQAPVENRTRVDLGTMVADLVAMIRPNLPRTMSIVLKVEKRITIEADAAAIRPLIMNLVTNASDAVMSDMQENARPKVEAASATGRIGIEVGAAAVDRDLLARLEINAGLTLGQRVAWIRVSDDGIGIDDATRARMFDPFFTTKSAGHGLGLSSVLGTMRAHHGAIAVESTRGVGTTMTVYLPVSQQKDTTTDASAPDAAFSVSSFTNRKHVLVVDDEPGLRRSLSLVLCAAGYETIEACNGSEAVAIARERGDDIALALIDQSMPEMGGFAAAREIRRTHHDLPIIMMSGYSHASERHQEGYQVIAKPFEPELLLQSIQRACRERSR